MFDSVAYMLDTNIFNTLCKQMVSLAPCPSRRLLVLGIQIDELKATKDSQTRSNLIATFEDVDPETTCASSFAFDIEGAGWDQACWNDGSGKFEAMLERLQELDPKTKNPLNQQRDILIAETAFKKGATLVTDDCNLQQVFRDFGGHAISFAELIDLVRKSSDNAEDAAADDVPE